MRCLVLFSLLVAGPLFMGRVALPALLQAPPKRPPTADLGPADDGTRLPGPVTKNGVPGQPTVRLPVRPYDTPRELLLLLGISQSELDSFADRSATVVDHREALLHILDRIDAIGLDDIACWQQDDAAWRPLIAHPDAGRMQFYRLAGRVHHIQRVALTSKLAALFGWNHYYAVRFQMAPSGQEAIVNTRHIPHAWTRLETWDERAGAVGLFLRRQSITPSSAELLFAARRIAWYPDRVEPRAHVQAGQVVLGDLGFDVGRFDTVKQRNGQPIGAAERECFYGLLHVTRHALPEHLSQLAKPFDLARVLQHPETAHGNLARVPCTAVRITQVLVTDPSIRQRLKLEHYYQIDALYALDNQVIELHDPGADNADPVYGTYFPITFCAARLPASWEGWVNRKHLSEEVVITGFFYKLWIYPSTYMTRFDARARQLSPMLIATEFVAATPAVAPTTAPYWSATAGMLFVLGLAILWFVTIRVWRTDRRVAKRLRRRRDAAGTPSFDTLDDATGGAPPVDAKR